jgi:hypothetical protein
MIRARQLLVCLALNVSAVFNANCGEQPFDVSLTSPHFVDLSPCYQRVVREAAAEYIGDFPPGVSMSTLHVVRFYRGDTLVLEWPHRFVPFSTGTLTLRLSTAEEPVCIP